MSSRTPSLGSTSWRRPVAFALATLALFAALAVAASGARADGRIVVNSLASFHGGGECPGPGCTLREALEMVHRGEVSGKVTISFGVEGSVMLEEQLLVEPDSSVESLLIEGPGAARLTLDGEGKARVLDVEATAPVTVTGLTIAHGNETGFGFDGGGGILVTAGALILEKVVVRECEVASFRHGGGIAVEGFGTLTMAESEVLDNVADAESTGGGIYLDAPFANTIEDSKVDDNRVTEGSGGGVAQESGALFMTGGSVHANKAEMESTGGGVYLTEGATARYEEVDISGNEAQGAGGGIESAGELLLVRSTLSHNVGGALGDALMALEGEATVEESTFSENSGLEATTSGPAVGPHLAVAVGSGNLLIRTSTIADNEGGGIANLEGGLTVRNSTIVDNVAEGFDGVGIEGDAVLESTILAGNRQEGSYANCVGAIASEGHNVLGQALGCTWTVAEGDVLDAGDPQLLPLGNYGGLTETMPPGSLASPAINHGADPAASDQRGLARPVPAGAQNTDVGAVEVQAPVLEAAPSISATTKIRVGKTLTCSPGRWNTDTIADPSYAYVWLLEGSPVGSGQTFVLSDADAGKRLSCEVTVDDGAATAAAESAAVVLSPAEPALEPAGLEFGALGVGSGPGAGQAVTLKNEGGADLEVTGVESSDPVQFPVLGDACAKVALAPGKSCEIEVAFSPSSVGGKSATLVVGTAAGERSVPLSGEGVEEAAPVVAAANPSPGETRIALLGDPRTIPVAAGGEASFHLHCRSPRGGACRVSLTLVRPARAKGLPARLGRWSGRLAAGASPRVTVPLAAAALRALGRHGHLRAFALLAGPGGRKRVPVVLRRG